MAKRVGAPAEKRVNPFLADIKGEGRTPPPRPTRNQPKQQPQQQPQPQQQKRTPPPRPQRSNRGAYNGGTYQQPYEQPYQQPVSVFTIGKQNPQSVVVEGQGNFIIKKGSMLVSQGYWNFDKLIFGPGSTLVDAMVKRVFRQFTGENMQLTKASGEGKLYLGWDAQFVEILAVQPGTSISVDSEHILAFSESANYSIGFVPVTGVLSHRGLFTTRISADYDVENIVIMTHGENIALTSPCEVDPDALVAYSGPDPKPALKVNWKTFIGQASGESYVLTFTEPNHLVIVQPSLRTGALSLRDSSKSDEHNPLGVTAAGVATGAGTVGALVGAASGVASQPAQQYPQQQYPQQPYPQQPYPQQPNQNNQLVNIIAGLLR